MKRAFDITFALLGLLVLCPVFALLAALVKLADGGPVLFRQERIGQGGRPFFILKFRSMVLNAERLGLSITRDGDPRVTRIGRWLRKSKLDELPQLWNVLVGEMSFVGPRPEVPKYVALYTQEQKRVLALKPGITDLATLEFREEEEMLEKTISGGQGVAVGRSIQSGQTIDVEQFYMQYCVPRKIELNLQYARRASVWGDLSIILRTVLKR